ncbi:MAG: FAD-dependent oxidoreductase [Actinomycetota bacterium]|nr:FAD-dependent oxidoreductase [Actinomycetota bacterium]
MLGSIVSATQKDAAPSVSFPAVPARDEDEARSISPQQTDCCIVGGGPAGLVLSLLLARAGVSVTVLEAHRDFEREFRGNTINPSVLEIMEELGLVDRLLELRHAKVPRFTLRSADGSIDFAEFRRLKTRYPYILMLPQARFLGFVAAEARKYPGFRLVMGARVKELIEEDGVVRGVRYRTSEGLREVRARLTIGADGRFSQVRRLADLQRVEGSSPIDVFWFNLPRKPDDPECAGAIFRFGPGSLLVLMDHFDHWQVGYIIEKGSYEQLRTTGLPALRRSVVELAPELADRVGHLQDWKQGSLLSVESDRLRRWYRPGLLLIGDAAHVMSPVGGVGINYAIQDAVVAANVLGGPLKSGRLQSRHLAAVQRRREWSTRLVQRAQSVAQRWVVSGALGASEEFKLPVLLRLLLRTPLLRDLFAYLIAFGAWPVHTRGESASLSSGWENYSAQEMKRIAEIGGLGQNERRKDPGRRSLRQGRRRGRRGAARGRVRGAGAGAPG